MAPTKNLRGSNNKLTTTLMPLARKALSKRSQNIQDQNIDTIATRGKRKAEMSPLKNEKIKRSALGNLTNNVNTLYLDENKKSTIQKINEIPKKSVTNQSKVKKNNVLGPSGVIEDNCALVPRPTKVLTRASSKNAVLPVITEFKRETNETTIKKKDNNSDVVKPPTRRISNEFNKTEESLYMSALEDVSTTESIRYSGNFLQKRRSNFEKPKEKPKIKEDSPQKIKGIENLPEHIVPPGINDIDKDYINDPFQVPHYAWDIFNYLKERESKFEITDYMSKQTNLSKWMRSLLVDWMVEVQETFELNHETLYLAVKLVDLYLCRVLIHKDKLQLIGAAALFIACKFDERTPPLVEDFLYVCDGAYVHDELTKMERDVLKTIDFDLGIPLSYRFLRRYARCINISMPVLTLARYILEFSLMDYATISLSDSRMACAALFIALRMSKVENPWEKTLQHFTGYSVADFSFIVPILNAGLHRKPRDTIQTIRNKYSHKIFHEVAKIPCMSTDKIFANVDM